MTGAKAGLGLKFLQWFMRGVQFGCCALILAIFSYFLATLHNHQLDIPVEVRAVEGISGVGVIYTAIGLLLLCCLAGHPFTSFIAIVLDAAFAGAFIYVAVVNRGGASSCDGYVNTPFGRGQSTTSPTGADGFTNLPSFRQACQLQTACLSVAIVAIFFFIFSIFIEISLVRHRRKEAAFGPSPANNYTSGYGRKGFFGRFKRRGTTASQNPNTLPTHVTPAEVRDSYATESTAIGRESNTYNKFATDPAYHHDPLHHDGQTAYPETGITNSHNSPAVHEPAYAGTGVASHHYGSASAYSGTGVSNRHYKSATAEPASDVYNEGVYNPKV